MKTKPVAGSGGKPIDLLQKNKKEESEGVAKKKDGSHVQESGGPIKQALQSSATSVARPTQSVFSDQPPAAEDVAELLSTLTVQGLNEVATSAEPVPCSCECRCPIATDNVQDDSGDTIQPENQKIKK